MSIMKPFCKKLLLDSYTANVNSFYVFFFFFIPVASLYNLKPDDTVTITKIHKDDKDIVQKSVQVDHVTLTIKVRTK